MHDLDEVIVRNRTCVIIVYVTDEDYTQWYVENLEKVTWVGSAYTCWLMKCMDIGASVAHK